MLGYIALIVILYLSVKLCISINSQILIMVENKIPQLQARILQFSPLLYIVSLVAFVIPVPWLKLLAPIPFGLLLLAPGILLGKKCANTLDCSGTDRTNKAKDIASNIMWLGLATLIFIIANIALSYILQNAGKHPWE